MKKVSGIIKQYMEAQDEEEILKQENLIIFYLYFPVLIIGAVLNFIYFNIFMDQRPSTVLCNSLFLGILAIGFFTVAKLQKDEKGKSLRFSLLFALTLVFCIIRLYTYIGPAIWTIGCIMVMISMVRIQREMLNVISTTLIILSIYISSRNDVFEPGLTYYLSQLVALIILFMISKVVHDIERQRNRIIKGQLELIRSSQGMLADINAALEEEMQEHRNTSIELTESEEKFRAIFEGASDPILIIKNNRYIDCNQAAVRIFGYKSKEKLIGKAPWDHSPILQPSGEESQKLASHYLEQAKTTQTLKFEWWYNRGNQSPFVVEIVLTPFLLRKEKVLLSVWRDISERKEMEQSLTYLSYHDQLTGFYNRRFFEEELTRMDTARNFPLSIIFADINGLKQMNDTFGHKYGDELIKGASKIISQECRADDVIARIGGDEFVILLPKTDRGKARRLVYRLRRSMEEGKIRDIAMSIAFGVETKVKEEERIYELINRAESNMYRNKRSDKRKLKR